MTAIAASTRRCNRVVRDYQEVQKLEEDKTAIFKKKGNEIVSIQ